MAFKIEAYKRIQASIEMAEEEVDSQPIKEGENIPSDAGSNICTKLQGLYTSHSEHCQKITSSGPVDILLFPGASTNMLMLYTKGLIVGYLKIVRDNQDIPGVLHRVHESFIKEDYRGKGYGVLMYSQAIKYFKGLCSSPNMGSMAVRTWKALAKKFKIRLWCCPFDKEFPFEWNSSNIPVVQGKPITRLVGEDFVFFAK
jgi:GNAT superfamily N-acetyltransferase